jgi:hypothetical protein
MNGVRSLRERLLAGPWVQTWDWRWPSAIWRRAHRAGARQRTDSAVLLLLCDEWETAGARRPAVQARRFQA